MTIETINELEPSAETNDTDAPKTKKPAAANRRDVALCRARKKAAGSRELILSERQIRNQHIANAATTAAAVRRLTPEQKLALEARTDEEANLRDICDMMFRVVLLCDLEMFSEDRPDIVFEIYQDYLKTHPYAQPLLFPRAWFHDRDYRNMEHVDYIFSITDRNGKKLIDFDRDAPVQFSLETFLAAVKRYRKWREQAPDTITDVQPEPKRGRGRPRKPPVADASSAVDPALAASWSTPPAQQQSEHWNKIEADRAARAIEQDLTQAEATKPTVFDGM